MKLIRSSYRGRVSTPVVSVTTYASPDMATIFPGYFYGYTAHGIVQLRRMDAECLEITAFDTTSTTLVDNALVGADLDTLWSYASIVGELFDICKWSPITAKDCYYASAPKGEREILFCSENGELFLFNAPSWLLTSCNQAAKIGESKEAPTIPGKMLLAVLSSELLCDPLPDNDLWRINNVPISYGKPVEIFMPKERIAALLQCAANYLKKKVTGIEEHKKGITLSAIKYMGGVPEGLRSWSRKIENRNIPIPILPDIMKDYLEECYLLNGKVYVKIATDKEADVLNWNTMFDILNIETISPLS